MTRLKVKRGWTITARLVTLALVPAALMLIAVNVSLYATASQEAAGDIRERGRLIAAALAEGSRYGVMSGNAPALKRTLDGLLGADPGIVSIQVLDATRTPLAAVASATVTSGSGNTQTFEAPIAAGALNVNLFDATPADAAGSGAASGGRSAAAAVGHVQVVMSPEPILQAKRGRLIASSAMVLLAALFSAMVGLGMAKRLREPLNAVMAALRGIRQGRYEPKLDFGAADELGELQATIVDMAKGLKLTHAELERQVAIRTRQLEQAVSAARAADAEKRRLIARGNALVEEERQRISLEIHDDLNALLVAIRLQAGTLASNIRESGQAHLLAVVDRIAELIDTVYERSRDIVQRLRPEIIDTLGLSGAIEEMVRHLDEADPSCQFRFVLEQPLPPMPDALAIAAYRVVQEALSNVVKHAGASSCVVTVDLADDPPAVRVTVRDDGGGFDTAAKHIGLGLVGMRERVMALNGSLTVDSKPAHGTVVTMTLPLKQSPP